MLPPLYRVSKLRIKWKYAQTLTGTCRRQLWRWFRVTPRCNALAWHDTHDKVYSRRGTVATEQSTTFCVGDHTRTHTRCKTSALNWTVETASSQHGAATASTACPQHALATLPGIRDGQSGWIIVDSIRYRLFIYLFAQVHTLRTIRQGLEQDSKAQTCTDSYPIITESYTIQI